MSNEDIERAAKWRPPVILSPTGGSLMVRRLILLATASLLAGCDFDRDIRERTYETEVACSAAAISFPSTVTS
jgi:hypothetical protein